MFEAEPPPQQIHARQQPDQLPRRSQVEQEEIGAISIWLLLPTDSKPAVRANLADGDSSINPDLRGLGVKPTRPILKGILAVDLEVLPLLEPEVLQDSGLTSDRRANTVARWNGLTAPRGSGRR